MPSKFVDPFAPIGSTVGASARRPKKHRTPSIASPPIAHASFRARARAVRPSTRTPRGYFRSRQKDTVSLNRSERTFPCVRCDPFVASRRRTSPRRIVVVVVVVLLASRTRVVAFTARALNADVVKLLVEIIIIILSSCTSECNFQFRDLFVKVGHWTSSSSSSSFV